MEGAAKVGKDKNSNVGATTVSVSGARSFISAIQVSVSNEELGLAAFGAGKAVKLKTTCDQVERGMTIALYRFDKIGFKPIFLSEEATVGASGTSSTQWIVANDMEDALGHLQNCKVLN